MALTAIILLVYIAVAVLGLRFTIDNDKFFDKNYTTVIKGLCCIIVIFVHIPVEHGNKLQDAVGSFANICVTLFFMFSAYGLKWSVENKKNYLNNFVINRIPVLLIPYIIMYIVKYIFGYDPVSGGTTFVILLLLFYVVFYLAYRLVDKKFRDIVIYTVVISLSFIYATTGYGIGWGTESLGFIYGIIMYKVMDKFRKQSSDHPIIKIVILTISSGFLGIMYLKYKYIWFFGSYLLRIILSISIIALLSNITIHFRIGNKFNRYLGKISYEVFLIHGLIMDLLNRLNLNISSGVYILLTIIGTILSASVLNIIDVYIAKSLKNHIITNK